MTDQLTPLKTKPVVLAILDGWGFSEKKVGNPIAEASTPNLDEIRALYPMVLLQASGPAVGMAWGEAGNSEVGHLNIGAGRIVEQYYSRINRSIKDKTFFSNPALIGAFQHAQQSKSRVHLIGLLTSGTVHAAFSNIVALVQLAAQNNFSETYLHLFLDGRDSGIQEGAELLEKFKDEIMKIGFGKIATVIGRDFAMDRDNNWFRTQKAFDLFTKAEGEPAPDLITAVKIQYQGEVHDSAMPALVSADSNFTGFTDNDALIFFNFREDSMRQILRSFIEPDFSIFPRVNLNNIYIATMTQYLENQSVAVAFNPPNIANGLAQAISTAGMTQMHIAETDKYAHVTYFFNGLREISYQGETDLFIDSVKGVEQNPEMSSSQIADKVIEALESNLYNFVVLNFANADLLAHTGNYEATVKGVAAVDSALGRVKETVLKADGTLVVTADHGNAESLVYRSSGEAETKHDDSPVFLFLVANQYQIQKDTNRLNLEKAEINGILPDVAPTLLELMNINKPEEMTGQSLLVFLLA